MIVKGSIVRVCVLIFVSLALFPPWVLCPPSLNNSLAWSAILFDLPPWLWPPYWLTHHHHAIILITTCVASLTDSDCTTHDCGHKNHSIYKYHALYTPKSYRQPASKLLPSMTVLASCLGPSQLGSRGVTRCTSWWGWCQEWAGCSLRLRSWLCATGQW